MSANARGLLIALILALCSGVAVVLLDKDYRPKKIAESNRGVFTQIPFDAAESPPEETADR